MNQPPRESPPSTRSRADHLATLVRSEPRARPRSCCSTRPGAWKLNVGALALGLRRGFCRRRRWLAVRRLCARLQRTQNLWRDVHGLVDVQHTIANDEIVLRAASVRLHLLKQRTLQSSNLFI